MDATYYALPNRHMGEVWLERTPPDFVFDIKAHALMTGQPSEAKRLPKEIREEIRWSWRTRSGSTARTCRPNCTTRSGTPSWTRLKPLYSAGKLGAVFLQYPRWFFPSNESRDLIVDARRRLGEVPMAVEFRNGTWFNEKNADRTLASWRSTRSRS